MNPYIQCIDISKSYPIQLEKEDKQTSIVSANRYDTDIYHALKEVSFEVSAGDRVGIIGANGAGKSTLLKVLAGIIKPSSGYVKMKGQTTALLEPNNLMYMDLTGVENIYVVGRLLGMSKSYIQQHIDHIVEFSELGPFINQPVRYYSSGMLLRLTMSIYKYLNPDILLMDEVLSVGDYSFRQKIFKTFKEDFSNIPVMMIVSHEVSDIVNFCNKSLYLKDGQLIHYGETKDVYESYSIEHFERSIQQKNESVHVKLTSGSKVLVKKYSEEITFELKVSLHKRMAEFKMILYVTNDDGPVLTDSLVFREDNQVPSLEKGKYVMKISIPPFLLNKGLYYTQIVVEDEGMQLVGSFSLNQVQVIPDDWEANALWNISPKYPFRPRLEWSVTQE